MQARTTTLRGMTWGHTRGYLPLVATAQRYQELHPELGITWEKRSLKEFEEYPVQTLAERYDLLVIDHPFIGYAARHGLFAPLDALLPAEFLARQASESTGGSHGSYAWDGSQWALAIDAATPVAAWRPDLIENLDSGFPKTWNDIFRLAEKGRVEMPGAQINCLMNFFGLCIAAGEIPFSQNDRVADPEIAKQALSWLRAMLRHCGPNSLARNPIQSLDYLSSASNSRVAYCLFPYGYSNYSRSGYSEHPLQFGDLPTMGDKSPPLTTTLGGTGLAISSKSKNIPDASAYAAFVVDPQTQRTIYTHAGGQPGVRSAWLDDENNRITRNCFRATLPGLERAFVRPRHPGYLHGFQEEAGELVHRHVRDDLSAAETIKSLDHLWKSSHNR